MEYTTAGRPESLAGYQRALRLLLTGPAMGAVGWAALIAVLIGTNLLDFATLPRPGEMPGAPFFAAVLLRIVGVFGIAFFIERRFAGGGRALPALLRFVPVFMIVILILPALANLVAVAVLGPGSDPIAVWLLPVAVAAALAVGFVGLLPMLAAAAGGQGLRGMVRALRSAGRPAWPLRLAYLTTVTPLAATHTLLTRVAMTVTPGEQIAVGIVDGLVSALQLACLLGLAALGWRRDAPIVAGAVAG
jgi:hypothetical protein